MNDGLSQPIAPSPARSACVSVPRLTRHCLAIKKRFLAMYRRANAGHVGASLSCAEMLTAVRLAWMAPADELILSKGHAAAALYSTLVEAGDLDEDSIESFYRDGTFLAAHPPPAKLARIPFATGSLGHGLGLAAGIALGQRLNADSARVFCISSDGELNEGSIWEAALFAAHQRLANLFWLIDRNRLQGFGRTEEVIALEPLSTKLSSFGFAVAEVDGHSLSELVGLGEKLAGGFGEGRPVAVICRTVKGRGLPGWEDTVGCHYLPLAESQYQDLVTRLEAEVAGA